MSETTILKTNTAIKDRVERERGSCAGCGCKDRALMVPGRGISKGYSGPMFCMGCNPRFADGGPEMSSFL